MSKYLKSIHIQYALVVAIFFSYQTLTAQSISSFSLVNAEEDLEIRILSDGDSIYMPDLNTNQLSIKANTTGKIGSIVFRLDNKIIRAENSSPYSLFGSLDGDYASWTPELKTYNILATVHSLPMGQGNVLDTYTLSVSFFEDNKETPLGPTAHSLTLVNADTDEDISEILEGDVFVLENIGTSNLNIRAEVDANTESVTFGYQDEPNYHTENLAVYAIGANDSIDYRPWAPDLGINTVTATAYTKDRAAGIAGEPLTISFEIIEKEEPIEAPIFVLRINSGGKSITLNDSIQFIADTLFIGNGKSYTNNNIADFLETTNDSIYKTERTTNGALQSFGYNIPVIDGEYEIKLHFAELYWGATGGGIGGEGKRVFSVSLENEDVITDYDMMAETNPMTAIIKTFTTTVTDGVLNINFGSSVDQPKVSAIEIFGIKQISIPVDCAWEDLADSSLSKLGAQSVTINEKLYVIGGSISDSTNTSVTEIYDPANNSWTTAASMPTMLTKMAAVAVDNNIWVIAGFETDSTKQETGKVQIYNTTTNTWSVGPSLPSPRAAGTAIYNEGKIHFFGGITDSTDQSDHYILDINNTTDKWLTAAALPNPRNNLSGAVINGEIYAIGGQFGNETEAEDQLFVDAYDPTTDTWTAKADLPSPRSHFEAVTSNNKIIIVGGKNGDIILDNVTEYDVALDLWTERCTIPYKLVNPSVALIGDYIIVANGGENGTCCPKSSTFSMYLEPEIDLPEEEEEEEKLSVLIYHETGEFRHASIQSGIDMISEFGNDLDWTVTESQTSDVFTADSLATFDVVIWLNTTGDDILTTTEQASFEAFIQNGGGYVGIHAATDTYRSGSWPWYNDLAGAIVQVSPYHTANNTNATMDVVGEHAAITHLGVEWNKNDEYYYWERNGGYLYDGNINLLEVRSTGANSYDMSRPTTWYKEYDGGRSFYTALGHNNSDYNSDENFRTMMRKAIIWAAEKGEMTTQEEETASEQDVTNTTEDNIIVLFPNPVVDQLFIGVEIFSEVAIGEVSVFGMDGTLLQQKTINATDNLINLSELTTGYYVAIIKIGTLSERHLIYKN